MSERQVKRVVKTRRLKLKPTPSSESLDIVKFVYDESMRLPVPPTECVFGSYSCVQIKESGKVVSSQKKLCKTIDGCKDGTVVNVMSEIGETILISKNISLIGAGKVRISVNEGYPTISVDNSTVFLKDLVIENNGESSAIYVNNGSLVLDGCKIKAMAFASITCVGQSIIECRNCSIYGKAGPAVFLSGSTIGFFSNCSFIGGDMNGIVLKDQSSIRLHESQINGFYKTGILVHDEASLYIDDSQVTGCGLNGIEICARSISCINKSSISGCGCSGIVSGMYSSFQFFDSTIMNCVSCGIDCRDGCSVRSRNGVITQCGGTASYMCCDHTIVESENDKIFETGSIAVCSIDYARVSLLYPIISTIKSKGILCSGSQAYLSIIGGSISETAQSSIVCINQAIININDVVITNSKEVGILIKECKSCRCTKVKVDSSQMSGIEISNSMENVYIEESSFTRNLQCGVFLNSSKVDINQSHVIENSFSGFEFRSSMVGLKHCTSTDNLMGGICVRNESSASIDHCLISSNSLCGIAIDTKSDVSLTNSTIEKNTIVGIAIVLKSTLNIRFSTIKDHKCIALQVEGNGTRARIHRSNFLNNQAGLLGISQSRIGVSKCEFLKNSTNVELRQKSSLRAEETLFSYSNDKASINILSSSVAQFEKCKINNNKGLAIASNSNISLQNSEIKNNDGGGIFCYDSSSGTINHNDVSNNHQFGIYIDEGSLSIDDNVVSSHSSYGIILGENNNSVVNNNEYSSNGINDIFRY